MSALSAIILVLLIVTSNTFILPTSDDFANENKKDWEGAETHCLETYNTHLVSIHDQSTFASILAAILAINKTEESFYIGLSGIGNNASDYTWIDGTSFDYGTTLGSYPWVPGRPNEDDQGRMYLNGIYGNKWDDAVGQVPYYWICNSPKYVFSDEKINGNAANTFCNEQNPSMELISIHSKETLIALQQFILRREEKQPNEQADDNYMIGLRRDGIDPLNESLYYWTDGTPFDYGNIVNKVGIYPWHDVDPNYNEGESCIRLQNTAGLLWDDVNCNSDLSGVKGKAVCLNQTITSAPTTSQPTTSQPTTSKPTYTPTTVTTQTTDNTFNPTPVNSTRTYASTSSTPISTSAPSSSAPTNQPSDATPSPIQVISTPTYAPTQSVQPSAHPTERPSGAPIIPPTSAPTVADDRRAPEINSTKVNSETAARSGGNAILNDTDIVIIIIGCAIAACCFMFGGFYLMKKSKKVQTKDRDKMQIVTTSDGRTEIIPDSLHIIPSNSSDINNLLSSPSPQQSTYNNTMNEGNGIPLTTPPKRKNYGVIKKTNSNLDIETDALDTYEIGDDDEEQGDGPYGANGHHQGYRKADSSGDEDEDEDDMVVTKGNTVGDDNEIDPDQDRLIKKFKKSSTVGGDEDFNQQANIGRDEFVVDGDDDEYEYYEDEYEDEDDDERRKETAGFIDDEAHDGIVSDNEHEHDRFVIEGGIDENKPLDEIENEENEEKKTPENDNDNDGIGNDEFVVIGDDDINIMTPNEDDPTDNGY